MYTCSYQLGSSKNLGVCMHDSFRTFSIGAGTSPAHANKSKGSEKANPLQTTSSPAPHYREHSVVSGSMQ